LINLLLETEAHQKPTAIFMLLSSTASDSASQIIRLVS
jgi:hypothetical protein